MTQETITPSDPEAVMHAMTVLTEALVFHQQLRREVVKELLEPENESDENSPTGKSRDQRLGIANTTIAGLATAISALARIHIL